MEMIMLYIFPRTADFENISFSHLDGLKKPSHMFLFSVHFCQIALAAIQVVLSIGIIIPLVFFSSSSV
jgi:hypothetical protein